MYLRRWIAFLVFGLGVTSILVFGVSAIAIAAFGHANRLWLMTSSFAASLACLGWLLLDGSRAHINGVASPSDPLRLSPQAMTHTAVGLAISGGFFVFDAVSHNRPDAWGWGIAYGISCLSLALAARRGSIRAIDLSMKKRTTTDESLFRKERWPNFALGGGFFLLFAWWFVVPWLLGIAVVWPFRQRITALFRAKRRWEQEIAIGFCGFLMGLIAFVWPFLAIIKHVF